MKWVLAIVVVAFAPATGPPLTHAQLVSRADAICVRHAPQLASPRTGGGLGDPVFDAAWLKVFERQRRELTALRPPQAEAARYRRFLDALPSVATAFRKLARAIEQGRPVHAWAPLVRRMTAAEREAGSRARAVGLRRCFPAGKKPSPPEPPQHGNQAPPGRKKGDGGG
jgi:hypothetical protein